MWWHKLIPEWTKKDYTFFSVYSWSVIFGLLIVIQLIEGRNLNILFNTAFPFTLIPIELAIVAGFQNYSSNTANLSSLSALIPSDFSGNKLLKADKSLVFFYAE